MNGWMMDDGWGQTSSNKIAMDIHKRRRGTEGERWKSAVPCSAVQWLQRSDEIETMTYTHVVDVGA